MSTDSRPTCDAPLKPVGGSCPVGRGRPARVLTGEYAEESSTSAREGGRSLQAKAAARDRGAPQGQEAGLQRPRRSCTPRALPMPSGRSRSLHLTPSLPGVSRDLSAAGHAPSRDRIHASGSVAVPARANPSPGTLKPSRLRGRGGAQSAPQPVSDQHGAGASEPEKKWRSLLAAESHRDKNGEHRGDGHDCQVRIRPHPHP
jgi:hypothetical protein